MMGFTQRAIAEHADAAWVIGTHATEAEARVHEAVLAARHGLPTVPFVARTARGGGAGSVVGDQRLLDRIFEALDTETGALDLLDAEGLGEHRPHHRPQTHRGRRRNLTITLCGDRRGRTPMHRISLNGDDDEGRRVLETLGLSVRTARAGSAAWRFE